MRTGLFRFAVLAAAVYGLTIPPPVRAQEAAQAATIRYTIVAGDLARALTQFSEASGLQLVYTSDFVKGLRTQGLSGSYTPGDALALLLKGTGLTARFTGPKVVALVRESADHTRTLGPVRVEGAEGTAAVNGINGSRDTTATEGTGSFTSGALTVGGKVPQSIKDTPQSVSVLTAERMEQQNITSFDQALAKLPGITLVQGQNSLDTSFYSRGFKITNIQIDGGAPLTTAKGGALESTGYFPLIDMSQYDHVELLRGTTAYFSGYGDPSGTINLVRKKPLDHKQVTTEAQIGSWQNYRLVLDATSPLALDDRLRGRVVTSYQDNHQFYDIAKDNRTSLYGVLDFDLTPTTLVTGGVSYTQQNSVPWFYGLPRYEDGGDLHLPRSTSLVFPWNRWDFSTTEKFLTIEQQIAKDWTAKLNVTNNYQSSSQKLGFVTGPVNRQTLSGPSFQATMADYAVQQWAVEGTTAGSFTLFGQRQQVFAGASYIHTNNTGPSYDAPINASYPSTYRPYAGGPTYCRDSQVPSRCPAGSIAAVYPPVTNIFAFDPSNPLFNEPSNGVPRTRDAHSGQEERGAYLNVILTAFDKWHLATGVRWTRYDYRNEFDNICNATSPNCLALHVGDVLSHSRTEWRSTDTAWPPPVTLSYDVTENLTAHAGYTDIYLGQGNVVRPDGTVMDPATGGDTELGLKWQGAGGRLNASLSGFRIEKKNLAILIGQRYRYDAQHDCCFIGSPDRKYVSTGVDVEVAGALTPAWQIDFGYTYSHNEYQGASYGAKEGQAFLTQQPENLAKLWTTYDFTRSPFAARLSGLSLSLGASWQSTAFQAGTACTEYIPGIVNGESSLVCGKTAPYNYTQDAYAVWSMRADYAVGKAWSLSANVDNLLDTRYYQTQGSSSNSNWYGPPRSFTVSLRGRF